MQNTGHAVWTSAECGRARLAGMGGREGKAAFLCKVLETGSADHYRLPLAFSCPPTRILV